MIRVKAPEARVPRQTLRSMHRVATRIAATRADADDLVQDVLLIAIEQSRDWTDARFVAWASGVIRRRVAFLARTAGRRRRRDESFSAELGPRVAPETKLPLAFVATLAPALQTVALLANAGMGRVEVAAVLGLSDVALRKRVSDLHRAWRTAGHDVELAMPWPTHRMPCGRRRRALRAALRQVPAARLAVTDPDGHTIFLGPAHTPARRGNQAP